MTVCVGTLAGIWADRKITSACGKRCARRQKVFANESLIAAAAGENRGVAAVERAVRGGAQAPEALLDAVSDHSEALVLWQGRLWLVSEGDVQAQAAPAAIGSGGEQALAFLSARGKFRPCDVQDAIRYVFSVRDDCGGGITFKSV